MRQEVFNKIDALSPIQTDKCEVCFAEVAQTAHEPVMMKCG